MKRVIEKIMPFHLATGIVAALVVIIGLDINALGRIPAGREASEAQGAAQAWIAKNESRILKGIQSMLVGSGVWVGSLGPGKLEYEGVSPQKESADERKVVYALNHERVAGKLELSVNMRTSTIADVGAHVTSVRLVSVGPRNGLPAANGEVIYTHAGLLRGRVGYFLYVAASVVWHFVVAGILYGLVALTGLGPRRSIGISFLLSVAIIAYVSSFDSAWLAGSAALIAVGLAWYASVFIRHKRHLEVLRIITQ